MHAYSAAELGVGEPSLQERAVFVLIAYPNMWTAALPAQAPYKDAFSYS